MSKAWRAHTIVFDLDDTLYPERDYVLSGFAAVEAWLRETHGAQGFATHAGALFAAGRRGKILDEALPLVGLQPDPALVARLVEVYRTHVPKLRLFPDAVEVLEWAAPRFRLALITDGYGVSQTRKIQALGLEERIPCRILTGQMGCEAGKPSPEPYRRVMAFYPGAAAGFVYVGDNPHKDFLGAKRLGWHTVRIRRPGGEHAEQTGSAEAAAEIDIALLSQLALLLAPEDDPARPKAGPGSSRPASHRFGTDPAG